MYERLQITVCQKELLYMNDISSQEITFHSVATTEFTGTSQALLNSVVKGIAEVLMYVLTRRYYVFV